MMHKVARLGLLALLVFTTYAAYVPWAKAAPFSRPAHTGYFLNDFDDWGNSVLIGGIHPNPNPLSPAGRPCVESFINIVFNRLNSANANYRTGAAFLILNMLGRAPGTSKATAYQANVQADWERRVRGYSDNNWIQWGPGCNGVNRAYDSNTYWQGDDGGSASAQSNPDDIAWFNDPGASTDDAIIFHRPGTSDLYMIREACANPLGDSNGLFNFGYDIQVSGGPGGTVMVGGTYDLNITLRNTSTLMDSYPALLEVQRPAQIPAANGTPQPLSGGMSTARGFHTPSVINNSAAGAWYWNVRPLNQSQTVTTAPALRFTVPASVTVGTTINFLIRISPDDESFGFTNPPITVSYTVISQRFPAFMGQNGDIHAGGGICQQALSNGRIETSVDAGSYGDYVLSAGGTITNTRSNGSGANPDSLKLGSNGSYLQVCRPNLYQEAQDYAAGGGGGIANRVVPSSQDFVLNGPGPHADTGSNRIFYLRSAPASTPVRIRGVVAQNTTLVVDGDVIIEDDIVTAGGSFGSGSARDIPTLGIIARGSIFIDRNANQVDAFLFASAGDIHTCLQALDASAAVRSQCATPPLLVKGFLMARGLYMERLGQANTNGPQPAEIISLNPLLYLNPPALFDGAAEDVLLSGQGERQPLF